MFLLGMLGSGIKPKNSNPGNNDENVLFFPFTNRICGRLQIDSTVLFLDFSPKFCADYRSHIRNKNSFVMQIIAGSIVNADRSSRMFVIIGRIWGQTKNLHQVIEKIVIKTFHLNAIGLVHPNVAATLDIQLQSIHRITSVNDSAEWPRQIDASHSILRCFGRIESNETLSSE